MRTLGTCGGWMFFEHAGSAVAVDLTTDDVTDVFAVADLKGAEQGWNGLAGNEDERRAALLARSALAIGVDPLRAFKVPETVRASARQALHWQELYERKIPLPVVASVVSLVPPHPVQETARHALAYELDAASRARAEQLCSGRAVSSHLFDQMALYFSRHQQGRVPFGDWASWGGEAGRVWADRTARLTEEKAQSVVETLATEEKVDYDTLRLLPRAFSILGGAHTPDCDGAGNCACGGSMDSMLYPSGQALAFLGLGGEHGRKWASRLVRAIETNALTAAAYEADANVETEEDSPTDQDEADGTVPHVYRPVPENPTVCLYCGLGEQDELHDDGAVNYALSDVTPEDAHYFTGRADDLQTCEVCGNAVDDTLHKQAALAGYYLYKDDYDKKIAETQEYWATKGGQPEQPVVSAADTFGEWVELPPEYTVVAIDSDLLENASGLFDRSEEVDDEMEDLFWQRRGHEDQDPLTYYVSYVGDDQMLVDQLYVSDGSMFYTLDPVDLTWVSTGLESPAQVYEIDDESAEHIIRGLSIYPQRQMDLRDVDPGEALLMEQAVPYLDDEMYSRFAIVTPFEALFDDGYTPQERAENAGKQVRDANGRFAKSGSRVAVGTGGKLGTIGKIDRDTQQVQVAYDDGQSEWVDARQVNILKQADGAGGEGGAPARIDISKIEGKPRATANTPKALLPAMLPPMDADALRAVIENYPNFIEKERAGHAARQAAQQNLNEESRRRVEREQARAEADYRRRLQKVHRGGKSARDWVDRIYNKILPGYKRRPSNPLTATVFAKKKEAPAPAPAAPAAGQPITDPAQSDVQPVYMAEVDEANQQNVLELLALVPASTQGSQAQVLRYTATGWIPDQKMMRQLQSTAPPPIVALDEATFNDTLAQVKTFYTTAEGKAEAEAEAKEAETVDTIAATGWGEYGELVAAGIPGIADTPSDIAATEKLKRYWTLGEGGTVKIRWNTPGDMTRCMRHLRKYMPSPDVHAGYCAKLHHEMTGEWPGDRRNVGRRGSLRASGLFTVEVLSSDDVIAFTALVAGAQAVELGVEAPETAEQVPRELSGARFRIPIVAPVGVWSGDGRKFAPLSLTTRDLPLPLMWQIQTSEGHDSSVIVGRIDAIERGEDGSLVNAVGVFDVGPYGQEAERLVRHKFLRGVSVDLDEFEAEAKSKDSLIERERSGESAEDDIVRIIADQMTVTNGRVMGATLVAKPAFQECTIEIVEDPEEEAMVADGIYIGTPQTEAETEEMIRSALTAAGIPITPPAEWFDDPNLRQETPLTVLDDGRVYGHIATWNTDHVGLPFSTRPPRSRSNYAYFHTGLLRTGDGKDVHVGQITLAGGHADLTADAQMAVKHYDDTASAFCDVHAGEDAHGIWVAGALRPGVTGEQIRAIRASAPSGDWRPISGRLEMVAICQVNVPGFPVTRARVASGHVYALVAAGTSALNKIRAESTDDGLAALLSRVDALEMPQREALAAAREAAFARLNPAREEHQARLAAAREAALSRFAAQRSPAATAARERVAALMSDGDAYFRDIGTDKRKEMAKKGAAMPDGSYPISTVGDLKNAIRAYGRASKEKKTAVRRHIRKRARALGKTDLIPESWASMTGDPFSELAGEINDLAARMALVSGAATMPLIVHGDPEVIDNIGLIANPDQLAEVEPSKIEIETTEQEASAELLALFGRGPGWVTNPEGTRKLHAYWVKGEGAGKIGWGTDGDFARCEKLVGEKIAKNDPEKLRFIKNICAQWHKDATGATPGNAPGESAAESAEESEMTAAGGRYPDGTPWNPQNHPRDEKGRFRLVIAELKKDLEAEAGTGQAVEGLDEVQQAADQGNIQAAQDAAKGVLELVDKLATNTEDADTVKTLREGYGNLAEAVANLPLAFGDLNEKYRFTDLPQDLQSLVEDLFNRAKARLDPKALTEAGGKIEEFMAGGDVLSQPQISAELSRILRFLI